MALYHLGNPNALEIPGVLIIGTQRPSPYGIGCARRIALRAVQHGFTVIGGLADGIDAAAQQAAIDADGISLGVLPHGLDHQPRYGAALAARLLAAHGTLVSEHAGHKAMYRGCFRDYCITQAQIAQAVIVIECPLNDGTFWTINAARWRNLPIATVQFPVGQPQPSGNRQLITDGVTPLSSAANLTAFFRSLSNRPTA